MSARPSSNALSCAPNAATVELPDVATATSGHAATLDWVGMEEICLPLQLAGRPVPSRVSAGVSLDSPEARGIHMSRLYLALRELAHRELDGAAIRAVLDTFLVTHAGLSDAAYLDVSGEVPLERSALTTDLAGWKAYPFRIESVRDAAGCRLSLEVEVGYSSTCPCSAALARQAIQEQFDQDFAAGPVDAATFRDWLGRAEAIVATPHSQRSEARVRVNLDSAGATLPLDHLVDSVEDALGTALQTAVKRADEKAFALANGRNPMFCEDAARRIDRALREPYGPGGYSLCVRHRESLHAHDAVARIERAPQHDPHTLSR